MADGQHRQVDETEGLSRLVAWDREMRDVHDRLRSALQLARATAADEPGAAGRDLLLFCHGFCVALTGHHRGEDRQLFPALVAEHPELVPVVEQLTQDHSMIDHLIGGLQKAVERGAGTTELERHLDGIEAIMESHFRYEERQLLVVLEKLSYDAEVADVLGPL